MRRSGKEMREQGELDDALGRARYLIMGIPDDPVPYLVPLFYGFEGGRIYIHCAAEGTKFDLIRRGPRVSFCAVEEPAIIAGKSACDFSARARSVIGYGRARIVTEDGERRRGLDALMRHYSPAPFSYRPESLEKTVILAIDVEGMRGKKIK